MTDRIYYIVPKGHELNNHINNYMASVDKFNKACRQFSKNHCSDDFWQNSNRLVGLSFKGDIPAGWGRKQSDPRGMYTPYGRSKESNKIREEIKKLPTIMSDWEWEKPFGEARTINKNGMMVISFTSMEEIDNNIVLGVPARPIMPEILSGCIELKTSEYYALKEKLDGKSKHLDTTE
jgi:hypothetical protein